MLNKFLAVLCIFNLSCAGLDYKRNAYNSVAMVKFETIDPKTKDDSYITGTAFAVDENYLVTAAHVCVAGVQEIVMKNLANFSVYLIYLDKDENISMKKDFKIVDIDRKNDLCLIFKPKHGLRPVTLSGKDMKLRDPVFAVGAPASTFPIESEGVLSLSSMTVDGDQTWPDVMLMSLDICGGNSGGPVFDKNGNVVGVIVAGSRRYDHIAIVVKAKYVIKFLKNYSANQVPVKIREK